MKPHAGVVPRGNARQDRVDFHGREYLNLFLDNS
jgi:hypothetical protein